MVRSAVSIETHKDRNTQYIRAVARIEHQLYSVCNTRVVTHLELGKRLLGRVQLGLGFVLCLDAGFALLVVGREAFCVAHHLLDLVL